MTDKIAISSESNKLDGKIDPRFGRAVGFIIFDLENNTFKYLDNGLSQTKSQGAGIQTASKLVNENVKAILTGSIGPKAYKVLKSAKLEIIQDLDDMTIDKAIALYKKGKLISSTAPKGGPGKRIGRKL